MQTVPVHIQIFLLAGAVAGGVPSVIRLGITYTMVLQSLVLSGVSEIPKRVQCEAGRVLE
jgi:hypothetical protein